MCDEMVDAATRRARSRSEESGFRSYPIPNLEHQIVGIRHLQHRAAQLADRLRASADLGIRWVGARRTG
jgi:hypothetical protein